MRTKGAKEWKECYSSSSSLFGPRKSIDAPASWVGQGMPDAVRGFIHFWAQNKAVTGRYVPNKCVKLGF